MVVRTKLTTKGIEKYLEDIAKAGQDVDAAADEALLAGGEVLLAGMQRRVAKLTGNLEENLVLDGPYQDGNFHYVLVGISNDADADTARYGNVQEYGSSSMPAQPYIRPAMDEDKTKARRAMRKSLEKRGTI